MAEIYPQKESRMALEYFRYMKAAESIFDLFVKPLVINQANSLHCGNCMAVCPFGAVEKR